MQKSQRFPTINCPIYLLTASDNADTPNESANAPSEDDKSMVILDEEHGEHSVHS